VKALKIAKTCPLALALLLGAACSAQGTPATTLTAPAGGSAATQPTTAAAFHPVSSGHGPCVGVKNPTNVNIPSGGAKTWSAPEQVLQAGHTYCAILTTEKGRIVAQLYPEVAPKHVNSFIFLANQGYYDGITWHRVLAGFMAQTGDPTGTGSGGPGYALPLETSPLVKYDREGVLGMARTNVPDSAGSQFFITFGPQPSLDPGANGPGYTIFGQVVEGMNVVRQISLRDPEKAPTTPGDKLVSVRIVDLGSK
jgi:peptidylprolyl isomerase